MRRLLVPTRISLALRMATGHPVSRGYMATATSPPPRATARHRRRPAATVAPPPPSAEILQQLWVLTRESTAAPNPSMMICVNQLLDGIKSLYTDEYHMSTYVKNLSDCNDFATIEKLLEAHSRILREGEMAPRTEARNQLQEKDKNSTMFRAVTEALWAAAHAKSIGSLSPSILKWIEEAVRRLPKPIPSQKESLLWLLSIVRDDLSTLQKLQQESIINGRIGPEIEREKTLRHVALTYLKAGKDDQFRSIWPSSSTPFLGGEEDQVQSAAMMHHALLRRAGSGKPDPAMLRWYTESLSAEQRTPIQEKPQFEAMMVPMMKNLGGKIEKWGKDDMRKKKMRKWRDDYDDSELDNLRDSLLNYMRHLIVVDKVGNIEDMRRLERMLARLDTGDQRVTMVIDWLNLVGQGTRARNYRSYDVSNLFPWCSLIVVGRERNLREVDITPRSPEETERIKVMNVSRKIERRQEVDDLCALILAVATRGHLLTNDKTRPHVTLFGKYCLKKSKDLNKSILLQNYLNDAVLRHDWGKPQPAVDHSRAAQWIDKEKKELAFTVARKADDHRSDGPFSLIDYYSLHIV